MPGPSAQANPKHRIIEQYPTVISDLQIFPCLEQIRRFRMVSHVLIWSFAVSPVLGSVHHAKSQGSAGAHRDDAALPTHQAAATAAGGRGGGQTNSCEATSRETGAMGLGNEHVIVDDEDEDDDIMPIIYMI